jgi:hypothetical protein
MEHVEHREDLFRGFGRSPERRPSTPRNRVELAVRWSSRRKTALILELLRGANLESTSRKYRLTVATMSDWRDQFLARRRGKLEEPRGPRRRREEASLEVGGCQPSRKRNPRHPPSAARKVFSMRNCFRQFMRFWKARVHWRRYRKV